MRVSRLKEGDWQFGRSRANYITRTQAISQNVVTRLKSFANDWFLDVDAEIDWLSLLGQRKTKDKIKREIVRVTLATEGVLSVDKIEIIEDNLLRNVKINLTYTDIYSQQVQNELYV